MSARIYIRRNGAFGSSCDGTLDTGHVIIEGGGLFTVWSVHDDETVIADGVSRPDAEKAIEVDWRRASS